jgi:two-component system sensor histidine kinase KdpD
MTVMGGSLVPEDTPGGGLTMVVELPLAPAPPVRDEADRHQTSAITSTERSGERANQATTQANRATTQANRATTQEDA